MQMVSFKSRRHSFLILLNNKRGGTLSHFEFSIENKNQMHIIVVLVQSVVLSPVSCQLYLVQSVVDVMQGILAIQIYLIINNKILILSTLKKFFNFLSTPVSTHFICVFHIR